MNNNVDTCILRSVVRILNRWHRFYFPRFPKYEKFVMSCNSWHLFAWEYFCCFSSLYNSADTKLCRNPYEFTENTTRNFAASPIPALDSYYLRSSIYRVIYESRTICRDNVAYINNMSLCAKYSASGEALSLFVCLCRTHYIKASCARSCACIDMRVYAYVSILDAYTPGNKQCATIALSRRS